MARTQDCEARIEIVREPLVNYWSTLSSVVSDIASGVAWWPCSPHPLPLYLDSDPAGRRSGATLELLSISSWVARRNAKK